MKRLLVTGGSGLVGGHVWDVARNDWEVFATYSSHSCAYPKVTFLPMDLENDDSIRSVITQVKPHAVIHCAAWPNIDICESEPERAFRINTEGSEILARACEEIQCRLIFTSTDMVFDGEKGSYSESDETHPINVYGQTKLAAEEKIQAACPNSVIARVALVYGKPQIHGNSFSEKILNAAGEGKVMNLFTDQIRTPVLVNDLARALLELADHDFQGIIHLGGATQVDRYQFGLRFADLRKIPKALIQPVTMDTVRPKAPRPRDVSLDTRLAQRILQTRLSGYYEGLERAYPKGRVWKARNSNVAMPKAGPPWAGNSKQIKNSNI